MYENVGGKIKGLARFIFVVGVLISCVSGIALMVTGLPGIILGIFEIVIGIILSWVSTLTLRGFGQLIEDTETIRETIGMWRHEYLHKSSSQTEKPNAIPTWKRVEKEKKAEAAANASSRKLTDVPISTPASDYVPAWKRVQKEQAANEQMEKVSLEKPDFAE